MANGVTKIERSAILNSDRFEDVISIHKEYNIGQRDGVYSLVEFDEERGYRETTFLSINGTPIGEELKYKDHEIRSRRKALSLK